MEELRIRVSSINIDKIILQSNMNDTITALKYLETPYCRKAMNKETLEMQRKIVTSRFRNLIIALASIE